MPGQADLRALGRRLLQEVGQRPRQRRLQVQVDHLKRQAGITSHGVVQAGRRVEFPLSGQHERLAALRQLHVRTQHVLALHHASLQPGPRVSQDRLGPADGILLHPAGRAGQEDVQVSGGHVERHRLVGPNALELSDPFPCDRPAVAAAGPPEVVQDPFQPQLGMRVTAGPGRGRQEEPLGSGHARSQVVGDGAVLPEEINLR